MQKYISFLQEAYDRGEPVVTDTEYDWLLLQHPEAEKQIGKRGNVAHPNRLYSLRKYYIGKDEIPSTIGYVQTPKLDGCAVSLVYLDGKLYSMTTRGDGRLGNDITSKAQYINIPETIKAPGLVQITGEVINGVKAPNGRNIVAGALNLDSLEEFFQRVSDYDIGFVAYNIFNYFNQTYLEDMLWLQRNGFYVVTEVKKDEFTTDGIVYRLNSNSEFYRAGFTDKFPRGAFAVKTVQEGVATKLLDVEWQTGGSGKITPVAILEPVEIGGAVVSRATLNNIAYIESLNLEIGCTVRVIRSGEIIPMIVERIE